MSAQDLLSLDVTLGYAEVLLVWLALSLLGYAFHRRTRSSCVLAVVVSGLVGVTVAQPFGVKGVPISPQDFAAGNPRPADEGTEHRIEVLGMPLFRFRAYTREIFYLNGEGGYPSDWLKVRSWVWPGVLTNAAKVERLCGIIDRPCWAPGAQDHTRSGLAANLDLVRAGGQWRYRILRRDGAVPTFPPRRYPGGSDSVYGYNGYYRLAVGIASVPGLIYWLVASAFSAAVIFRLRRAA